MKETTSLHPSDAGQARSEPRYMHRMRRWVKDIAVGPASWLLSRMGLMVSREDVLWCYRHILEREPESEEAVLSHLRFRDFRTLVQSFVDSAEYPGKRMVSRDDVLWCYEHILGREPESEEAALSHLHFRDFRALVQSFVDSAEYPGKRMVSRDDVLWCYEHILGREPESEEAVLSHLSFRDFRSLVQHFTNSSEYRGDFSLSKINSISSRVQAISAEDFRAAIEQSLQCQGFSRERDIYIETHFDRLLHTINAIAELLPSGGRMIDFSARLYFTDTICKLLPGIKQASVTGVNFERDDYAPAYGTDAYDLCLNTEVIEHLLFDPAHMAWSINRMLKCGGLFFLSSPNALAMANLLKSIQGNSPTLWNQFIPDKPYYERHNRDWTPFEVARLLEEHGFEILEIYTRDFYDSTHELLRKNALHVSHLQHRSMHHHFGDTLCIIARKVKAMNEPVRNSWLYCTQE